MQLPRGRAGYPAAGMRISIVLTLFTTLFLLQQAAAGSLDFTVAGGQGPLARVAVSDMPLTDGRGSLGLHWAGAPGLTVHLRRTTTFGPLGNVILDIDAGVDTAGRFTAALAGRGALGPVAVRLRLHAANSDSLPAARAQDSSFAPRPPGRESLLWGVQAGATWRLSRELQLVFEPAWLAGSRGGELLLPVELQLPRRVGDHDLRLRVSTMIPLARTPESAGAWSSAGAGLRVDRGRRAAWEIWLLAGGNDRFFSPGLSFAVQEPLAGGDLRASFRLEPWRSDLSVLDVSASWSRPFGAMRLDSFLLLGLPGTRLSAGLAWAIPID